VSSGKQKGLNMKKHVLLFILCIGITSSFSKENNLKCFPFKLKAGDTLTILMTIPHEKELAIVDPDGTYFLLSYNPAFKELNSLQYSIFNYDHFDTVKTIKLDVNTVEGSPYISGKKNNEKIFIKTGRYKVVLSSDLHTEDIQVYERNIEFVK
jgi:hypothetical protein